MTAVRGTVVLRAELRTDADVLAVRRAGREAADRLGLDTQDQVRVATALSEVGRAALVTGSGSVTLAVVRAAGTAAGGTLRATVRASAALPEEHEGAPVGVRAAQRLLDHADVSADGTTVVLDKALPAGSATHPDALRALAHDLGGEGAADAHEELRVQNSELVRTLDELTQRSEELARLNEELEETNRGVVAMYGQLSAELEETNTGVVALYAELDERGRQLAAANEAKTRFLRSVSHELRSPVNSVIGLSSLLAESPLDAEQRQQVTFLQESAGALLTLVDELLDLARAESGREEVVPAPLDLADLVEELRGTTTPLLRPGVRLEVRVPDPVPALVTDRRLLGRVLRNLLSNAAKFTEQGGLTLAVRTDLDAVLLEVRDTGLGIDPDRLASVFEEFVQIPNRLQPGVRGTGLGLPYARRVSEALGGTLTAASVPGEGSVFTVRLPAGRHAPAVPAEGLLGHVLVVDDDPAYAAVVVGLLQDAATRVSTAHDAEHALVLLARDVPDVVLLDVRMPGVDGTTVLVRLAREHPGLPVVLMSSGPEPALPAGAAAVRFLAKSAVDRETLVAALAGATGAGAPPATLRPDGAA